MDLPLSLFPSKTILSSQGDSYFHFHYFVQLRSVLIITKTVVVFWLNKRNGILFFSINKMAFLVLFHRQVSIHLGVDMFCYIMLWVKPMVNEIFGRKYLTCEGYLQDNQFCHLYILN